MCVIKIIRGKFDCNPLLRRRQARSKYGTKVYLILKEKYKLISYMDIKNEELMYDYFKKVFIKIIMKHGKKSTAEAIFEEAF